MAINKCVVFQGAWDLLHCGPIFDLRQDMAQTRIEMNPEIMAGKPVIRGTRIPVETVLRELGAGLEMPEILEQHPRLTHDDVLAALAFAAAYLAEDEIVFA